ncbi:MAG: ThiF family adenylyltransferase [Clostridium celatum]|uniref:ThiF family adenylyltransferase n=1 Tax=Clostridium tertium TaxID=1559 RepID=UPI002904134B|nr:ThiF family adenylyltransferase [Clostridium celatum]
MYSIVIVGCGATGSNIATFVSQLAVSEKKIEEIVLIDGDKVESKNFRNQKFSKNDINKPKSQVLATRFSKLEINISYIDKFIRSEIDLIDLFKTLKGTIILVGAVDNNLARSYMDLAFYSNEVPDLIYIDTGNGDIDRCGQTVVGAKKNNEIVAHPLSSYFDLKIEEEETKKDKYKCSQIEEHPQNLATNILSATTTFLMISNIISGRKVGRLFARFNVDTVTIGR